MTETQITTSAPTSVFITGATSALGRAVTRLLVAAGHTVTGTVKSADDATKVREDGGIPAYPDLHRAGEIRSVLTGVNAKVVLNLAPQLANHLPQYPAEWDERLTDAATAVTEAAADAGVEFVVHSSYAFADAHADETTASILRSVRLSERIALNGSVPACVLRFGFLYGAESNALLAVREMLRMGRPMGAGPEDSRASWVYAADAAHAVLLAMQQRPAGAVFTIVDGHLASPAEFLNYFAESHGFGVSGGLPLFAPRLPQVQQAVMGLNSHADNSSAQQQLGWTPRFASYRQGIDDLLLTWRAHEPIIS